MRSDLEPETIKALQVHWGRGRLHVHPWLPTYHISSKSRRTSKSRRPRNVAAHFIPINATLEISSHGKGSPLYTYAHSHYTCIQTDSFIMIRTVYLSCSGQCIFPLQTGVSLFNGMERWNGTVEWNDGMEWNDHAYPAHLDDRYLLCLSPSTKKQQPVAVVLKKTGSI